MASCCDWMPVKMKTLRTLAIEKVHMQEEAPPLILTLDNVSMIFANFVAPGNHYFYFVQGRERCFLSPHYSICRFKETNVFLNVIHIESKIHRFDSVFTLSEGFEDEEVFLIDHSVFAKYQIEQLPQRTRLMFKCHEKDISYTKLLRLEKGNETELKKLKNRLWIHYERLVAIWLFEIGRGELPQIGWNDFTAFANRTGLKDG